MQGKRFELSKGLTHQPLKLAHLAALPPLQKLYNRFSIVKVQTSRPSLRSGRSSKPPVRNSHSMNRLGKVSTCQFDQNFQTHCSNYPYQFLIHYFTVPHLFYYVSPGKQASHHYLRGAAQTIQTFQIKLSCLLSLF